MKPFSYHPFDLRQLVSFAEIARTGSFRQAAKTLHVAQPALSRQIKKLEAALRVSLFDRQPHRLRLTLEGRELAARLPILFSKIDLLAEVVGSARTGGFGHLRVGDAGVLTTELLAPALRQVRKKWPDLRVSFAQNTSEGFFRDLLDDTIDCAFPALQPRSIELASHKLSSLEIGLVLPPGHPLGTSHEISYEKLRDEAWIFPPREANPILYDKLLNCCHRAGFSPNVIAEMTQRPRVISQVACGIGVATLVETLKHLCIGGTTYHRLVRPTPTVDGLLAFVHEIAVAFLRDLLVDLDKDFR